MNNLIISVIMPFYNCEKFLDDSIQSILNQSFTDFEFIIINDASTDNSDKVIQKYIPTDNRIIYIKNSSNVGIVENLNKGIEIAKGEYIARMDGDDISSLDRFEKQLLFLETNKNIDIVGSYVQIIDENNLEKGKITKPIDHKSVKKNLLLYLTIVHAASLIRIKVYNKIGGYNNTYLYTEDTEWTYKAILGYSFNGANIPEYLYSYRKHSNSTNTNSRTTAKKDFLLRKSIIKKYNINIGLKAFIGIYAHLFFGVIFTGKQKESIEKLIKKII